MSSLPTEHQESQLVAKFLDWAGVLWCHVPNEGRRHYAAARKLQSVGLKRGVPDILIFTPPPKVVGCPGAAIEMKRQKGGKVSEDQQKWLDGLKGLGWQTLVARGAEEAIRELKLMGYGSGVHLL